MISRHFTLLVVADISIDKTLSKRELVELGNELIFATVVYNLTGIFFTIPPLIP